MLQVYWMRIYMILEGAAWRFPAERVGSDCTASLTVANKGRQTDPGALMDRTALYGRGDDDDAALEVIGLTGTGVPTTTFCTAMSRVSQAVAATRCFCGGEEAHASAGT